MSRIQPRKTMKACLIETTRDSTDGYIEYVGDLLIGMARSTWLDQTCDQIARCLMQA